MGDNAYCHILSGLGAGFFAVVCGSPVDVVKSRLMSESQSVKATLSLMLKLKPIAASSPLCAARRRRRQVALDE